MVFTATTQSIGGTEWTASTNGLGFPVTKDNWYAYHYRIAWMGTGATSALKVAARLVGPGGGIGTQGTYGTQNRYIMHQNVAGDGTGWLGTWGADGHWTDWTGTKGTHGTIKAVNTGMVTIIEGRLCAGTSGTFSPVWGNRGTGGDIFILPGSWGWYMDMGKFWV
jgi:hypothetical protein